jgi:hypothetical protein
LITTGLVLEVREASSSIKETSKATNSDDAAVSVEEWDLWLVAGLGSEVNEDTAKAAKVWQKWRLNRWKRQSTQGFSSWLHQQPDYQGVGLDSMDYVVVPAQLYNPQAGDEGSLQCAYQ